MEMHKYMNLDTELVSLLLKIAAEGHQADKLLLKSSEEEEETVEEEAAVLSSVFVMQHSWSAAGILRL